MELNRRSLLRGMGAAGVSLSFAGFASASDTAEYVVTGGKGVRARLERAGFQVAASLADGRVSLVRAPESDREDLEDLAGVSEVARNVRFELEEPVESEPESDAEDEPLYGLQWDKQVTEAAAAHDTATGDGATIGVIDTGIHYDHPDLSPGVDEDAGRLFRGGDVYEGFERQVEMPVDPNELDQGTESVDQHVADDAQYHGSHVAGIAAASADNDFGIAGTAPDATLVSLRVFYWGEDDDGAAVTLTTTFDILQAIEHAGETGIDAANMSLGTPPLPPRVHALGFKVAYEKVIQRAASSGTVVVASAGNSSANLQQGGYFTVPNSTAGAVSVSATGPNDERVFYSNYGTNEIDVGAPGGGYETLEKTLADDTEWPFPTNLVLSTVPPRSSFGAPFAFLAGTSMAAPQVAGTVALARELAPDASPRRIEAAVKHGAEGSNGRSDPDLGAGRINALNTVERLADGNGNGD